MPSTDEDILRAVMRRCTEDVHAPASIAAQVVSHQRRRARRGRLLTLTATTAALGTAAGVVALVPRTAPQGPGVHHTSPAITLTAAQRTLYRLSSAAARQPEKQGRYVVLSEKIRGGLSTSVIDSRTGDFWGYQKVPGGPPVSPENRHWSPTQAQFDAMPTAPATLRALLIAQYDKQSYRQNALVMRVRKHAPQPKPKLADIESASGKVFQQANGMLWNPLVGPALRAALFKVLAATPAVRVDDHATDKLGRPAVEITWTDRSGAATYTTYATYEDPATAAVLEQTYTYTGPTPAATRAAAVNDGYDLYLSITRSNKVPPDPYH